ncbi:unnamed protein product [Phyllotreta striolata]|uniref:Uncharacterized protein n=1 Tax=Phyllotreta striolata TaxID=444603 RepID=A0A9N9XRV9_PHYSR|nr:unnamed protein product [Phyllotreta striolata]
MEEPHRTSKTGRPRKHGYGMKNYTKEQKIVAAVWYHERHYTGMTYEQLKVNFYVRFRLALPENKTLRQWELQLFRSGGLSGKRRRMNIGRLMHIPYVRESFIRFPNASMNQRSEILGIATGTLSSILLKDMTPEEIEALQEKGRQMANNENVSVGPKVNNMEDKKTKIDTKKD